MYKASYLTKDAWNVEERHQEFLQRLVVLSPTREKFDTQRASSYWEKWESMKRREERSDSSSITIAWEKLWNEGVRPSLYSWGRPQPLEDQRPRLDLDLE